MNSSIPYDISDLAALIPKALLNLRKARVSAHQCLLIMEQASPQDWPSVITKDRLLKFLEESAPLTDYGREHNWEHELQAIAPLPDNAELQLKTWFAATHRYRQGLSAVHTLLELHTPGTQGTDVSGDPARRDEKPAANPMSAKLANRHTMAQEMLARKTVIRGMPIELVLDPTNNCNLQCQNCYQRETQDFCHMDIAPGLICDISRILPQVEIVNLFGTGEAMLSRQLPRLLREMSRYQINVNLLTNGTVPDTRGDFLPHVKSFGISLDAATAETFELLRTRARFNQVADNIQRWRSLYPELCIYLNMTVNRANLGEMQGVARLAIEWKLNAVYFQPFIPFSPALQSLRLTSDDIPTLINNRDAILAMTSAAGVRMDYQLSHDLPPPTPLTNGDFMNMLRQRPMAERLTPEVLSQRLNYLLQASPLPAPAFLNFKAHHAPEDTEAAVPDAASPWQLPYCSAPWTFSYIECSGNIRPCCQLNKTMGNLYDAPFATIWNAEPYASLRRAMFHTAELPPTCKTCQSGQRYLQIRDFSNLILATDPPAVDPHSSAQRQKTLRIIQAHFPNDPPFFQRMHRITSAMVRTGHRRVLVYPACTHARLMLMIPAWQQFTQIAVMADDISGDAQFGFPVITPRDLATTAFDAILISSQENEQQFAEAALNQTGHKVPVYTIYGRYPGTQFIPITHESGTT